MTFEKYLGSTLQVLCFILIKGRMKSQCTELVSIFTCRDFTSLFVVSTHTTTLVLCMRNVQTCNCDQFIFESVDVSSHLISTAQRCRNGVAPKCPTRSSVVRFYCLGVMRLADWMALAMYYLG